MTTGKDIPREVAMKLCDEIRAENKRKRFSIGRLQCWGCYQWARGDTEKLCLSSKEGCNLVNNRYKLRQGHQ
jgi:hypothetical protein